MNIKSTTPTLDRAIAHMLLDNGCVNTGSPPVAEQVRLIKDLIDFSDEQQSKVNAELAIYNDEQLFEICCGEIGAIKTSTLTDAMLTACFNAI